MPFPALLPLAVSESHRQAVHFDPGSQFPQEDLLEVPFLKAVFRELMVVMGTDFHSYEWWIFSHQNGQASPRCLEKAADRPRVLIWLSDEYGTLPEHLTGHFHAIFKNYLPHTGTHSNLFHFPVGYAVDLEEHLYIPVEDRPISVYFQGNLNRSRIRLYEQFAPWVQWLPSMAKVPVMAVLKRIPGLLSLDFSQAFEGGKIHFKSGFMQGDGPSYTQCLSQTQISLCPDGFVSAETFRHMESMRYGSVLISPPLPDKYLYRNSPIIQVENWTEGLEQVRQLLQAPDQLTELHRQTLRWWDEVCSESATARHVAHILGQLA